MLRRIDIENLQPGMVIVKVTQQNGPVKIKKSGLVSSQDMVQGLIEMGILQVEIDTDQSVEVTPAKIKKSPTQKMLENNRLSDGRIDHAVPNQFHRSLFLSSAQDIPSSWLFYTKRYMLAGLMVAGGLGLGWTMANYSHILELVQANQKHTEIAVAQTPQVVSNKNALPTNQTTVDEPLVPESINKQPIPFATDKAADDVAQVESYAKDSEQIASPEEAEVVTPTEEIPPNISPELLQRFEQAISDVEVTPAAQEAEPAVSEQDVPRIDQLPAWVMTRLPSMAFSAHMYASQSSERWVRVNGSRMVEGDKIDGQIEIIRIEPQHVILNYSGQTFSMAALTDW